MREQPLALEDGFAEHGYAPCAFPPQQVNQVAKLGKTCPWFDVIEDIAQSRLRPA